MVGKNKGNRPHMGRIPHGIHPKVQRTSNQSKNIYRTDKRDTILRTINGIFCLTELDEKNAVEIIIEVRSPEYQTIKTQHGYKNLNRHSFYHSLL